MKEPCDYVGERKERWDCGLDHFRDRKEASMTWIDLGEDGSAVRDKAQRWQ